MSLNLVTIIIVYSIKLTYKVNLYLLYYDVIDIIKLTSKVNLIILWRCIICRLDTKIIF